MKPEGAQELPIMADLSDCSFAYALELLEVPIPKVRLTCSQHDYENAKPIQAKFYIPNTEIIVDTSLKRNEWYVECNGKVIWSDGL